MKFGWTEKSSSLLSEINDEPFDGYRWPDYCVLIKWTVFDAVEHTHVCMDPHIHTVLLRMCYAKHVDITPTKRSVTRRFKMDYHDCQRNGSRHYPRTEALSFSKTLCYWHQCLTGTIHIHGMLHVSCDEIYHSLPALGLFEGVPTEINDKALVDIEWE